MRFLGVSLYFLSYSLPKISCISLPSGVNFSAFFILLFSKNLVKLRLLTLISSIFLIIIITFINPRAKERVWDKTLEHMNLFKENEKVNIFSKAHNNIYTAAYKMFLDNKVLGVGVKNFRIVCNDPRYFVKERNACSTHPHNTYIQILSETGIIGFTFLLFAFFYFSKYIFKHLILKLKKIYYFNDFEICILSGIAIYLWPLVPTGSIFNNWLNIIMIINIPFLIWSRRSIKNL